jgi:hypothetical protein
MPDTGAPWNIPYVDPTDLVRDYPQASEDLAEAIADGLDAAGNAGIGSNVVQTVKTNSFSTTSATFVAVTDFDVTITPTSATAKVLVIASYQQGHSANRGEFRLLRDSTVLGRASFIDVGGGFENERISTYPTMVFLDTPATTSAITYSLEASNISTGTLFFNRPGVDSVAVTCTITAIEVAV